LAGLPAQPTWKTRTASEIQVSNAAAYFQFLSCRTGLKAIHANASAKRERHSPKKNKPLPVEGEATPATYPVVRTVRVTIVPGDVELGPTEHVGARAGVGCTEQVNTTDPAKEVSGFTFKVAVEYPPGLTVAGVSAEADSEKSKSNTDHTTTSADPVFTWQMPVPVQPPVQPVKMEPAVGAAVSVIAVPGG
jgi:hypothetical protein